MTTAVIGATGRVGSEIVRGLIAHGDEVVALVREADKPRRSTCAARRFLDSNFAAGIVHSHPPWWNSGCVS